jgi:hypothetical protein
VTFQTPRPQGKAHCYVLAVLVAPPPGLDEKDLHFWAACFLAQLDCIAARIRNATLLWQAKP